VILIIVLLLWILSHRSFK